MHLYGQYCPVARAAEILADRWTVLIVRELLADVSHFNALERGLPHMSRTLLAERLKRLEQAGVLERRGASRGKPIEYRLTVAGRELQRIIDLFGEWGARWAFGPPRPDELDPIILLWWMRRRVASGSHFAPPRGHSVRLSPRAAAKLLAPDPAHRCLGLPERAGFRRRRDRDCRYRYVLPGLARSHVFSDAVRKDLIQLDGAPADVRAFPAWFSWSPMARTVHAAVNVRSFHYWLLAREPKQAFRRS